MPRDIQQSAVAKVRALLEPVFDAGPVTLDEVWEAGRVDIEDSVPYLKANVVGLGWKEIGEAPRFPVLDGIWFGMPRPGFRKIMAAGAYAMALRGPQDLWEYADRVCDSLIGYLYPPSFGDWRLWLEAGQVDALAQAFTIASRVHGADASDEDAGTMVSLADGMRRLLDS